MWSLEFFPELYMLYVLMHTLYFHLGEDSKCGLKHYVHTTGGDTVITEIFEVWKR